MQTTAIGRLLKIGTVIERTSRCRAAIYRDISKGSFPAPVPISAGRVAWPEAEIEAWIAAKIAAGRNQAA